MAEEKLWREAKNVARIKNRSMDWAYILDIYTALGGYETRVFFQNDLQIMYRLLGTYTAFQDLVITNTGEVTLIPHEEVLTKRKSFDKLGKNETFSVPKESLENIIGPVISKGYKQDTLTIHK